MAEDRSLRDLFEDFMSYFRGESAPKETSTPKSSGGKAPAPGDGQRTGTGTSRAIGESGSRGDTGYSPSEFRASRGSYASQGSSGGRQSTGRRDDLWYRQGPWSKYGSSRHRSVSDILSGSEGPTETSPFGPVEAKPRSSIPPYKSGSFISMNASNATKRSMMEAELERLRAEGRVCNAERSQALAAWERNVVHQLHMLDAAAGREPRQYGSGTGPVIDGITRQAAPPETGRPRIYKDAGQEYREYAREARTPSLSEYQQLQRAGAHTSYGQYAHEKQSAPPKSYEQFSYERAMGKPDSRTYGDTAIVKRPEATYYSESGKYVPANFPSSEYMPGGKAGNSGHVPATSYIIYTSNEGADFSAQAEYQRQKLEEAGETVVMKEVNSVAEFEDAWNDIGDNTDNVSILSHSRSHALIFREGPDEESISVNGLTNAGNSMDDLRSLSPKNIKSLSILSCNAGHLDEALSERGNVAQAFAGLGGIEKVIAYDGNVGYGFGEDIIALAKKNGEVLPNDELFPRISGDQNDFYDTMKKYFGDSIQSDSFRLFPQGQVVYYPDGTYEVLDRW